MKKITGVLLVLAIVLSFAGCGEGKELSLGEENSSVTSNVVNTEEYQVELLNCSFVKELYGQDAELKSYGFPSTDGKVYVDLALKVENTGTKDFTKDNISAYFMYKDLRCDMQFEIESMYVGLSDAESIEPNSTAIVHLFDKVDDDILNENIVVNYFIDGKEYTTSVIDETNVEPLSKKTKVTVGEKINCNNMFEFEVISCGSKEYIMAQDTKNSEIYEPFGGSDLIFVDLVIKIKNISKNNLSSINAYTIIDDAKYSGNSEIEIENNTKIDDLSSYPLKPNEEGYCHLYVNVDKNTNVGELFVRFNLGGICYYCEVEK